MRARLIAPFLAALVAAAFAAIAAAGCSGDPAELAATDAWSRPTQEGATDGVVYLQLTTDTDETLVGVQVAPQVAAAAELHTSDTAGGGGHQHGAAGGGVVTMTPVEEVPVAAGATVEFRPGGNHIMLVDLAEPLEAGDTFTATLRFASGRSLPTEVIVADNPPA
jgi:copper(I)-binding protein